MRKNGENKENRKKSRGAGILVSLCGTFALVIGCASTFGGIAEAAAMADMGRTERIETVYSLKAPAQAVPEGYTKASYKVKSETLEYYKDKKPSEKDLTQKEAAEIGAQLLWQIYGVKLDKATVYMGYDNETAAFPRASWSGRVEFGQPGKKEDTSYFFMIDAITGEGFNASYGRTLSVDVDLGPDLELEKNPGEYLKLATEFVEKKNLVHGEVKKAVYNCQGYASNDPSISINVYGVNGESVLMSYSRYDQTLLGISLSAGEKISELAQQMQEENEGEAVIMDAQAE